MSIANYLTLLRLIISPIFLFVYLKHDSFGISSLSLPYVLLFLWLLSELSDAFDGYLARKYNQVTDLGKILDPMADSISRITVFLSFTEAPVKLPIYLVFIFLYRDSVVSTLRTICALKGFALAARLSGKIKAIIQAVAAFIILVLLTFHAEGHLSTEDLQQYSMWIVLVAGIYALFSGVDYIHANKNYIAKLLSLPKPKVLADKFSKYYRKKRAGIISKEGRIRIKDGS